MNELIKRIAKNNPSLCGNNTLTINEIYFFQTNGEIDKTETFEIPLEIFFGDYTAVVGIYEDGYIAFDTGWLFNTPENGVDTLELDYQNKTVLIPIELCDKVKNDDGLTRNNELPF